MKTAGLLVLVAIVLILGLASLTHAQGDPGIEHLGHVGIAVSDLERALHFYVDQLGLKESFRLKRPDGTPSLIYLRVAGSDTFVELFPGTAKAPQPRPYHFGLFVTNLQATLHALQARGYSLPPDSFEKAAKVQADGTLLYFIKDPDGNTIELSEVTPASFQAKTRPSHR